MPVAIRFGKTNGTKTKGQAFLTKGADLLALVVGCTASFTIHFVGELYFAEMLLVALLPVFLVLRGKRTLRPELKVFYSLMGLWLLGLVISDAYNHTNTVDRLRGAALIVFFAFNVLCFSMLLGENEKRKVIFLVGLTAGALAAVKLQPSPAFEAYPWKFGYSFGVIQLVMLLASYFYGRKKYVVSALLIIGICLVNLLLNYRSPVLDILVAFVLVYPIVPEHIGGVQLLPRNDVARLLILAILAMAAGETASAMVNFVTRAGYLNEEAQAKNEAQLQGKNLLLGGRPEFVIGLRAALDSPIVGHGSWAKSVTYYEMLYDALVESGEQEEQVGGDILSDEGDPLIPGHSAIVTAWVWAGIAGLIFWLYMTWFILRGIARVALLRPPVAPYLMWLLISTWWDIFFSPFAGSRRIIAAALVVFVADLMKRKASLMQAPWRRMGAVKVGRSFSPGSNPIAPARTR
jgi:hypothetical protein